MEDPHEQASWVPARMMSTPCVRSRHKESFAALTDAQILVDPGGRRLLLSAFGHLRAGALSLEDALKAMKQPRFGRDRDEFPALLAKLEERLIQARFHGRESVVFPLH
jgi:benzoyl-CoA reductase/2-hydroxyglutaryl-CoA dehydratase subunit BcrC/BadD/HgdB